MGIFTKTVKEPTQQPVIERGLLSPWSDRSTLETIVIADLFGTDPNLPVSRAEAMRIPAVVAARRLIISTIIRCPLKAYRGDEEVATQPTWLYRTNSGISPQRRMSLMLDDLIFNDVTLLATERGADGTILDAKHVPLTDWYFEPDGRVAVMLAGGGIYHPNEREVALVYGPGDGKGGVLKNAAVSIRGYTNLERAWTQRISTPLPAVNIQEVELTGDNVGRQPSQEEVTAITEGWDKLRSAGGGAGFTPLGLEVQVLGDTPTDLFVEGRNQAVLDISNHMGVPSALLSATTATASLTYSTQEGHRNEFLEHLTAWMTPIEGDLSDDKFVPRGQSVRFDTSYLLNVPTAETPLVPGPALED